MRDVVEQVVRSSNAPQSSKPFLAGSRCLEQEKARIKKYHNSRRSIRVWPIPGKSQDEISTSLKGFLFRVLKINQEDMGCLGIQWVERIRTAPRSKIKDEVRITFSSQFFRDEFASKGRLLGAEIDQEGRPTAGFRLDIPDFLAGDFKLLNEYGFRMRNVHGKETKKYIKYDDDQFSLFLELKLPQADSFIRIGPDLARSLCDEGDREEVNRLRKDLTARFVPPRQLNPGTSSNLVPLNAPPPRQSAGGRSLGTIANGLLSLAASGTRTPTPTKGTPSSPPSKATDMEIPTVDIDWEGPPPGTF